MANEITAPGFHPAVTSRQYFDEPCPAPALSGGGIKLLTTATAREFAFQHPALNPGNDASASSVAKRFGDICHQLALAKGRGYQVCEFDSWRTNDSKAKRDEAIAAGLTPILAHEFAAAETVAPIMVEAIEETCRMVSGSLSGVPVYDTEVVIAWQEETAHGPIWCRAMLDAWWEPFGLILDPKFTKRLADGVWDAHAASMGWDLQAAWYIRGVTALRPELAGRVRFINPLVHPDPPHVWRAREADEATLYSCQADIERAIERFGECLHRFGDKWNDWPGYPRTIEPWTARSYTIAERTARAMEDEDA